MKICVYTKTCTSWFIADLFVVAKIWKQLKSPSADQCKGYTVAYSYNWTPLSNKKEWPMIHASTCTNVKNFTCSEGSLPQNNTFPLALFCEVLDQAGLTCGGRSEEWLSLGHGGGSQLERAMRNPWGIAMFLIFPKQNRCIHLSNCSRSHNNYHSR